MNAIYPLPTIGHRNVLRVSYAQLLGEIEELRAATFAKEGILLFKTHKHSAEDLLQHPKMERIQAMCGQIDNVVRSWGQYENLSADDVQFYVDNRVLVEQRLSSLRAEIIERKPTLWEALVQTIERLLRIAVQLLPALPAVMLHHFGIRIEPAQQAMAQRADEIDDYLNAMEG